MNKELTTRQKEVFFYFFDFYNNNDTLPTVVYTADYFGVSANAMHEIRITIFEKGYLQRNSLDGYMFSVKGRRFLKKKRNRLYAS